ncbi:unnamed protein product [Nippostrongylus brasiliensis]|uniref:Glycoside hydrolase family 25 protein n=1 Tax=Nippostrongylus brasiliensis TaxID=27835 RepID=A0A0N4XXH3_NIPBR|nr:unnamed protein product [Nippostrongylus brasiliensis]
MRTLIALSVAVLSCFAGPIVQESAQQPSELLTTAYAVDLSVPVTVAGFQCIKNNYYSVAFIRAYAPTGSGIVDAYACANIQNANSVFESRQEHSVVIVMPKFQAGVGTEVYMTPQPSSSKTGATQFDEMYNNLRNSNINVRSIWVQVTSPVNWYASSTTNINFLNSILSRASQYGLSVGIYTNSYEWSQITGGATITNAQLWYWNTNGAGVANESPANYNDFRSFGGWSSPSVKQFAQVESVCGLTVNRDIYTSSTSLVAGMARREKGDQITVGGLGLGGAALSGAAEIEQ